MKTDRLYAMTLYLLNHGKTSATELSKRFEVSVRTVQRDIESLCQAGIPIIAETGVSGGYSISENFRMDSHMATNEDYSFILTALKGFSSAMKNPKIDLTLEKLSSFTQSNDNSVILDFSVLREGDEKLLQILQNAVRMKNTVTFKYTNSVDVTRQHTVEPIAVIYRWYAWYLLAYSNAKNDYRTYKLVRMSDAEIIDKPFTKEHKNAELILNENDKNAPQQYTEITVKCNAKARTKAVEYLNAKITNEYENGDCDMKLHVIEYEHLWFGTLLSLGDNIEIIEPEHIKRRVLDSAEKIISLYKKL